VSEPNDSNVPAEPNGQQTNNHQKKEKNVKNNKLEEFMAQVLDTLKDFDERLSKVEEAITQPNGSADVVAISGARPQPRDYKIINVPAPKAIQPQAIKCMAILKRWVEEHAPDKQTISEADAMKVLAANVTNISNNQTPWKVFAFYRANLVRLGYLVQIEKY
jgi:hypothetical protein